MRRVRTNQNERGENGTEHGKSSECPSSLVMDVNTQVSEVISMIFGEDDHRFAQKDGFWSMNTKSARKESTD
jgi:hypothetical protein